jgi:hypothetical protein
MNILKPCSYHYLFSHVPSYPSAEEAKKIAADLVSRLVKDLRLTQDRTEQFEQPHPDVLPLSSRADEDTQTYLLQFLSNDLLTTILTFNQTEAQADGISYWKRTLKPNFPETPDRIGQTLVLFAQAEPDLTIVQEIVRECFGKEINASLPHCLFDWGTLYVLPESEYHPPASSDSRQIARYVLLVPDAEHLKTGDQLLSFSFPMLEAIRQKVVYEKQVYHTFRAENLEYEREINHVLDTINQELSGDKKKKPSFEEHLKNIDEIQAKLYRNLAEVEALLLTLNINIENLTHYLEAISSNNDTAFAPLIREFRVVARQIDVDLKYIKILSQGMDKREELLRLKIEWQRKEAEERSNKIREVTNALIFAFGVSIGIGQILINNVDFDWTAKLGAMGIGGCVAYILNRWVGMERIKSFWDVLGWPKTVGEKVKK